MANYFVTRANSTFNCVEFLSTNGVNFTLHTDKAQKMSFTEAVRWAAQSGGLVGRVEDH